MEKIMVDSIGFDIEDERTVKVADFSV